MVSIKRRCIIPEGPEVANFVRSINKFIQQCDDIFLIEALSGRYTKKPIQGLANVKFPLMVSKVGCKGKFIYWEFMGTDLVLFNTLGMSGAWSNTPRHARVKFVTSKGDLYFNDARNFGTLKFCSSSDLKRKLNSLGPDMLNDRVSPELFKSRLKKHPSITLAEALMNQHVISGVGNYLKADSLWLANLSPHRLVSNCSDTELENLHESVRNVIMTAYQNGGSTILTYKGFDGQEGKHTMLVYGRKTDPNGETVISENTKDGRTTWWVPQIQK